MTTFLTTLHVMVCLALIAVVLLQRGKGADMGAALGGGSSNTLFGSRGAGNFLTKLTTGCAIIFMLTSLSLSYLGSQDFDLFEGEEIEESAASSLEETEGVVDAGALEEITLPSADDAGEPSP